MIESNLSLGGINSLFGNSIVVDVMTGIFKELFIYRKEKILKNFGEFIISIKYNSI